MHLEVEEKEPKSEPGTIDPVPDNELSSDFEGLSKSKIMSVE